MENNLIWIILAIACSPLHHWGIPQYKTRPAIEVNTKIPNTYYPLPCTRWHTLSPLMCTKVPVGSAVCSGGEINNLWHSLHQEYAIHGMWTVEPTAWLMCIFRRWCAHPPVTWPKHFVMRFTWWQVGFDETKNPQNNYERIKMDKPWVLWNDISLGVS